MAGSTFIQVPANVTDAGTLKRFLEKLILQLDIAFGNRGSNNFAKADAVSANITNIQELIAAINAAAVNYSLLDGTRPYTVLVSYATDLIPSDDKNLIPKKYADDTFEPIIGPKGDAFNKNFGITSGTVREGDNASKNVEQSAITSLGLTISNPPTQAQVQAISDKVDAILVALRGADIIAN